MNPQDQRAHPWPADGKWIEFRFRRATWMRATPWYMAPGVPFFTGNDVTYFQTFRFWFPFLTWNVQIGAIRFHGYIGWKPIPVALDNAFGWKTLKAAEQAISRGELFVQLSMRGGVGNIQ